MEAIYLEDAIRIAADGDAIIFVGAGVGRYIAGKEGALPNGSVLSNRILNRDDLSANPPRLDKTAGFAMRTLGGADYLYNKLTECLSVTSIDPRLERIYRLPWRRVYTTNYDDAIEQARKGHFVASSLTLEDPTTKIQAGTVVHLNGALSRVTPASLDRELSLTDRSYIDRNFDQSPWKALFKRDIEAARALFFVGYSLSDLDISRLLFSEELYGKTNIFVSSDLDEVDADSLSQFGKVHASGVVGLTEALETALADYKPRTEGKPYIYLRELRPDPQAETPPATLLLEGQFLFGALPEVQTASDERVFDDNRYIIRREQQIRAQDLIQRGVARDLVIVGELLSGKTSTALSISSWFVQQGYRAFVATNGPGLLDELESLASLDERIIVVFDGYSPFRTAIRHYAARRAPLHRMVMTEQAVHHEFVGDFIEDPIFDNMVSEVYLDKIADKDGIEFAALVNFAGYWGDRSGIADSANARHISQRLDSSLYKLLNEIIKSPKAQGRVAEIIQAMFADRRATDVFIAACVVNVLGLAYRPSDWSAVFDAQYVRRVLRNYDDSLRYFFTAQADHIFPRSGMLSTTILERVPDRNSVLNVIVKLFEAATKLRTPYDLFDDVYIRLMKFNNLQPLLRGPSERSLILSFYDQIRPIRQTFNNADYWLQLGIAATALDELSIASKAFDNAYEREAKKKNPNTRKIDNYFCRFQLKKAAVIEDKEESYAFFVAATNGLAKQVFLADNRHYPFKSGRVYGDIAKKHYHSWDDVQKARFVHETTTIRAKAIDYEAKHGPGNLDVKVLIRDTGQLLDHINKLDS